MAVLGLARKTQQSKQNADLLNYGLMTWIILGVRMESVYTSTIQAAVV